MVRILWQGESYSRSSRLKTESCQSRSSGKGVVFGTGVKGPGRAVHQNLNPAGPGRTLDSGLGVSGSTDWDAIELFFTCAVRGSTDSIWAGCCLAWLNALSDATVEIDTLTTSRVIAARTENCFALSLHHNNGKKFFFARSPSASKIEVHQYSCYCGFEKYQKYSK
ncbi:hypothetical protein HAX54_040953 [Datura stramonium]|uniref:Uncharacterized protein n=1 Tax=Datura stramonium TaxID=4076 RepID=A0ABS8VQX6_DATST|nr:hypothetical protein [Datura stramonium]